MMRALCPDIEAEDTFLPLWHETRHSAEMDGVATGFDKRKNCTNGR